MKSSKLYIGACLSSIQYLQNMPLFVEFIRERKTKHVEDPLARHVASLVALKNSCFNIVYIDLNIPFEQPLPLHDTWPSVKIC